jgi:hypothetical protein
VDISMNSNQRNTKYEGEALRVCPAFLRGSPPSLLLAACALFPTAIAAQASDPEPPAGEIRGAVTRINVQGDATALEGILVNLSAGAQKTEPSATLSDADGHFQFAGLSAGTYLLQVSQTGFKPLRRVSFWNRRNRAFKISAEPATMAASIDVQGQAAEIGPRRRSDATLHRPRVSCSADGSASTPRHAVNSRSRSTMSSVNIKGEVANRGCCSRGRRADGRSVTGGFRLVFLWPPSGRQRF